MADQTARLANASKVQNGAFDSAPLDASRVIARDFF